MTYVKINDILYYATINGFMNDTDWDNRESKAITLEMTYEEAKELFSDNLNWSIIYQSDEYINEENDIIPEEYDNSEYCVAGDITDHRNGKITVKMGKLTESEEILALVYGGI